MDAQLRVIGERTAELELPNACPTCAGTLELRISPEGVRSFCNICHVIASPRLHSDGRSGFLLDFRDVGLA